MGAIARGKLFCKNPSYYNPVRMPDRTRDRRNVVLGQMVRSGYLTENEADTRFFQKRGEKP